MNIYDYAREQGLTLRICQRKESMELPRYYIEFEKVYVSYNGGLLGVFGNGDTVEQALYDYCTEISGKRLIIESTKYSPRWENTAPKLTC